MDVADTSIMYPGIKGGDGRSINVTKMIQNINIEEDTDVVGVYAPCGSASVQQPITSAWERQLACVI